MRRITGEQYERIESSQETLDKWYDFLKKGAKNSGFGPNVYEHLKPFENNTYVVPSVDEEIKLEDSGRIFYEISLEDKIRSLLILNRYNYYISSAINTNLYYLIVHIVADSLYYLLATGYDLPDIEGINMAELKEDYANTRYLDSSIFKKALYQVLKSVDISYLSFDRNPYTEYVHSNCNNKVIKTQLRNPWTSNLDTEKIASIECKIQEEIINNQVEIEGNIRRIIPLIKIKYFENVYINKDLRSITTDYAQEMFSRLPLITTPALNSILTSFPQALNDSYMVLSLNPIDKIMASTKQPYGSCLSLAKEGENSGATGMNVDNGTGLFAMMPSDKVYMIYYCNGKHKNMYWEKEEWDKLPENRDKNKAYKFFKYSLRQFGYVCKSIDEHKEERILPGRTYLAKTGEIIEFELINALLLDEVGVKTGLSQFRKEEVIHATDLVKGNVENPDYCWYDNYGYARGIYFDNVYFDTDKNNIQPDSIVYNSAKITTGNNRSGSYRMTHLASTSSVTVNTFDLLSGKLPYDQYNTDVKICAQCGKIIPGNVSIITIGLHNYCPTCAEELHIKKCEICGENYKEEDAEEHRVIDLGQYLPYPERLNNLGKTQICIHELKQAQYTSFNDKSINNHYLCPFCGSIETDPWEAVVSRDEYDYLRQFSIIEIEGIKIKLRACYDCKKNCVICDCCKKLVLLDEDTFPVVLMGNRRIICPDCIEKIRLKKQKKEALKEVVQELTENTEEYITDDNDPQNSSSDIAKIGGEDYGQTDYYLRVQSQSNNKFKRLKDVHLQIVAMTSKKGKGYPAIAGIN